MKDRKLSFFGDVFPAVALVASAPYCKVSHIFGDSFSSAVNYLLTDASRDKTDTRCWFPYQPVLAVMGSFFESFYDHLTFYRTDTSLRQTVGPSHDGTRFRESYLCREPCIEQTQTSALLVAKRNSPRTVSFGRKFREEVSDYRTLLSANYQPVHRCCFISLFVLFENIGELGARERKIAQAANKSPAVYILSPAALDGLWREKRGSMNRQTNYRMSAKSRVYDPEQWNGVFTAWFICNTFLTPFVRIQVWQNKSKLHWNVKNAMKMAFFMSAGFALPGPSASFIQAAYAFRMTWFERVCERLGYANERYWARRPVKTPYRDKAYND